MHNKCATIVATMLVASVVCGCATHGSSPAADSPTVATHTELATDTDSPQNAELAPTAAASDDLSADSPAGAELSPVPEQEPPDQPTLNKSATESNATGSRPTPRQFTTTTLSGRLQHPELTEVSGIVSSLLSPGVLFAVNDSGNSATLYALQDNGTHLASWQIAARNRDWEDMSRTFIDGKPYLIIGDTGDNLRIHQQSSLHLFKEPALEEPLTSTLTPAFSINFTFEDGPRNVEAFAIDNDTVYLITKEPVTPQGAQASRIYVLPLTVPPQNENPVALYAGDLSMTKPNLESRLAASLAGVDLNHPTALDFDASGKHAYVLTYRHVVRFTRLPNQTWPDTFSQAGTRIHSHDLEQAEALAVDAGRAVFITSEHASAPVWALPLNSPL